MTELDERLAQVLRDAVPAPPRALDPAALRAGTPKQTFRRQLLAPALAVAVVIAVAVGVVVALRAPGDGSRHDGPAVPAGNASFEARPLVMPAQPVSAARANPFAGLTFRVPSTEDEYGALSPTQQQQLRDALRAVDCADPPELPDGSARVVCDSAATFAALLGPPILTAGDVTSAAPQQPSLPGGSAEWTVSVRFTTSGAQALRAWTSRHHTRSQSASPFQTTNAAPCAPRTDPTCSDFLAFVVDGRAISLPATLATLDSVLDLSGNFTRAGATRLAHLIAP